MFNAAAPENDTEMREPAAAGDLNAARTEIAEAFADLRPEIKQLIERFLDRRIRRRVDASDVAQAAYVDIQDRLERFLRERPMEIKSWLFFLTKMKTLEINQFHLRSKKRDSRREKEIESGALNRRGNVTSPSQQISRSETRRMVLNALQQLPSHYREIIRLRHEDGITNLEASRALDISENAASKLYGRALNALQKLVRTG